MKSTDFLICASSRAAAPSSSPTSSPSFSWEFPFSTWSSPWVSWPGPGRFTPSPPCARWWRALGWRRSSWRSCLRHTTTSSSRGRSTTCSSRSPSSCRGTRAIRNGRARTAQSSLQVCFIKLSVFLKCLFWCFQAQKL